MYVYGQDMLYCILRVLFNLTGQEFTAKFQGKLNVRKLWIFNGPN
jgi:hypothetical protein